MKIEKNYSPTKEEIASIYSGLKGFNEQVFKDINETEFGYFVRNENGEIIGGLTGRMYVTSVFVSLFWLSESIRGKGYGDKLIAMVESESKKKGIKKIFLDTYTFQAPDFYLKYGFVEVGRYTDFPKEGVDQIFFEKLIK